MARRSNQKPDPRLVDPRNRVALTREVRHALNVVPGDYVEFDVQGDEVRLHKLRIQREPASTSLDPWKRSG